MRKRLRKLLTLALTASMVLSMSTVSYAEEYDEGAAVMEVQESDAGDYVDSEGSEFEVSDLAGLDSVDEVNIDEAVVDSEGNAAAENSNTVSSPYADPKTWSKDPKYAKHTYGIYLPELFGYDDRDMISSDMIYNGKAIKKPALTGYDLFPDTENGITEELLFDEFGLMPVGNSNKLAKVSFNCIEVESGIYFIYAYGIGNEFDYANVLTREYPSEMDDDEKMALSRNNYYGMTADNVPAGVFDYTRFTWNEKDGGSGANGSIIFEGAVIRWSSGKKAEKDRIIKVDKLTCKNNLYATVSFDAAGGKWVKVNNKFQKSTKQPSFYPVLKAKKSYRNTSGEKIKATKEDKQLVKRINKQLKASPINFEIRRRPIAGTISGDYLDGYSWKYASLMGDDLDFKSNGKLKHATLQFKSLATVKEKDGDSDDWDNEEAEAGTKNTKAQVAAYYLTHVLKMKKMKDGEFTNGVENKIKAGEFHFKEKVDSWYTTKTIDGYETLIVFGANNMEGVAAFRKRKDTSVGNGFYKDDKNMFIMSVDDEAKVDDVEVEEAF